MHSYVGEYNYILALVAIIAPLSILGLRSVVTRELVNHPSDESKVMGTALVGRLSGVFITVLIYICLIFVIEIEHPFWLLVIAFAQMLSCFTIVDFWLQAKSQAKVAVVVRLSVLLLMSLGKLIIVWRDYGLAMLIYLYALEFLLVAVGYSIAYSKRGGDTRLECDVAYLKQLLGQSKWLVLSGMAAVIYLKVDVVMLRHLVDESEAGIYSVASQLSEVWYFIPTIVVTSFFPILLKAKKKDEAEYQRNLQKLNDFLLLIAVLIVCVVMIFAPMLIKLYGVAFSKAAIILKIHILAGIFIFMRALLSKWLIMEHLLKYSLVTQASGAILNIILNLFLIPKFQGVGAAYATLVSYAAASYFALFLSKDTRPMAYVMTRSFYFPLRWLHSKR